MKWMRAELDPCMEDLQMAVMTEQNCYRYGCSDRCIRPVGKYRKMCKEEYHAKWPATRKALECTAAHPVCKPVFLASFNTDVAAQEQHHGVVSVASLAAVGGLAGLAGGLVVWVVHASLNMVVKQPPLFA